MPAVQPKRRSKAKLFLVVAGVLAAGGALSYWALGRNGTSESTLIKGKVERGSIRISVNATGTLEAVRTVQVGSQITGLVSALHADYNSNVKQGQLLAEIDPRTFQSQVLTEEAQLSAAQSRLQSAQSDLANQEANLVQVEANLKVTEVANENAALLYERSQQLLAKGLVSANENDLARTNAQSAAARVEQARAAVKQAQAQIRSRQSSIEQARSDIVGAQAQLERARINLELTKIYSPVDGVVISRSVDIGQTVAASLSAPVLFLIANNLAQMQVKANIDEADIGKINDQVQVRFTVDAYPNDTFQGKISEVRLEPQTVQNVVTYSVIVAVENPQLKLKPGMTANLTIVVDQRDNVLTVPNAALRFTPAGMTNEQITALLQSSGQAPAATEGRGAEPNVALPPEGSAQIGSAPAAGGNGARGANGARGGARGATRGGGNGRGGRGAGEGRPQRGVVWVENAPGQFRPIAVRTGLTDGTRTEVTGAGLEEGMEIVVSDLSQTTTTPAARPQTNLPFGVPQLGGRRGGF